MTRPLAVALGPAERACNPGDEIACVVIIGKTPTTWVSDHGVEWLRGEPASVVVGPRELNHRVLRTLEKHFADAPVLARWQIDAAHARGMASGRSLFA